MVDFNQIKFDEKGFIRVILQDGLTGKVLKLAAIDRVSLEKTVETGIFHFLSEDNQENPYRNLKVYDIFYDTIEPSLLIQIKSESPSVIRTDYWSIYRDSLLADNKISILDFVYEIIMERKKTKPENSYVAKKMSEGLDRILKKIGEEAGEVIIASKNASKEEIGWEMADLIFHLWLILGYYDLTPDIIYEKLWERHLNKT